METATALAQQIRFAWRTLRRTPALTLTAVLTLGLGIGASTAVFSVVYGVLIRPLALRDPETLVSLNTVDGSDSKPANFSLTEFADWERQARTFDDLAIFGVLPYALFDRGEAQMLEGAAVSPHFFSLVGGAPELGRTLRPDDDRLPVVVLSHRLWERRFSSDPTIVGRPILLDGRPYTVLGVERARFAFPAEDVDFWTPIGFAGGTAPPQWKMRGFRAFSMIGRLKPGIDLAQAREDAAAVARELAVTYPRFNANTGAAVTPLRERLTGSIRPALTMLGGAVFFVLLVSCGNLASLALTRNASRAQEVAIRSALGASRARLLGLFAGESAILAIAGALVGVLLARLAVAAFDRFHPADMPRMSEIRIDGVVLAFALAVAVTTTLLFGTLPAWRAARGANMAALRESRNPSRASTRRSHAVLIVVEIALAVVLLIGGSLLARSLAALVGSGFGVRDHNVVTLKLNLSAHGFTEPVEQAAYFARLLPAVAGVAGVQSAGVLSSLPPNVSQMHTSVAVADPVTGRTHEATVEIVAASEDSFTALGVPLVNGRRFASTDGRGRRVVILSAEAARRLFPDREPIGSHIALGPSDSGAPDPEVIGVVGDVKYSGLDAAPNGAIYLPLMQRPFRVVYLVVRSIGDPITVIGAVRKTVTAVDGTVAVSDVRSLDAVVSDAAAQPRFRTTLLLALAGLAVVLAAVGLYGVMAHAAGERSAEFGVRMALGATPSDLLLLVARQGLTLTACGAILGVAAALALRRVLSAFLYGVGTTDPLSFAFATAFVLLVAAVATLGPARRAARADPTRTLRD